jgi:hypothetical protein
MFRDEKGKLIGVLPANIDSDTLVSHQGLTFGGFLASKELKTELMIDCFSELLGYLKGEGINKFVYKRVPYIYHAQPSDEDLYALFINDAKLIRRDMSSAIYLKEKIKFSSQRKRAVKKSEKEGVVVEKVDDASLVWGLISQVLREAHGVMPVHSLEEIKLLKSYFPKNINFYLAKYNSKSLSAIVTYETSNVVHAQYLASNEEGKRLGALDAIVSLIISSSENSKLYFDFGISTEKDGLLLNRGLIHQKEGFGARAIAHDFYRIDF